MTDCLNCGERILKKISLNQIFSWKKIDEDNLCDFCRNQLLPLTMTEKCRHCCKPSTVDICQDCQIWQKNYKIFNQHFAIFGYNQFMHDYFKKYKRYGDVELSNLFNSDLMAWSDRHDFDLITYVPSSPTHFAARGFDPVYELYKDVFDLKNVLEKNDADKPQAQKDKLGRMMTPQTFKIRPDFPKTLLKSKVLIVDDIYTTGRTILHARQLMFDSGFENIYTFSLTR
jgi:competence protein ComFC